MSTHVSPRDIRRTRKGCLTCRDRRKKCDERGPVCRNCARIGRECQWGQKIRFVLEDAAKHHVRSPRQPAHAVDMARPEELSRPPQGESDGAAVAARCDETSSAGSGHATLVPHSPTPASESQEDRRMRFLHETLETLRPGRARTASLEPGAGDRDQGHTHDSHGIDQPGEHTSVMAPEPPARDPLAHDDIDMGYGGLMDADDMMPTSMLAYLERRYVDAMVHSHPYNDMMRLGADHPSSSTPTSTSPHTPSSQVGRDVEARLLHDYMQHAGHWGESMDPDRWFTAKGMHLMLKTPAWRASAYALTANFQCRVAGDRPARLALELYQEAVQTMITSYDEAMTPGYLASCVLLAVCEMMTSTYDEWRRHLEGCAALFRSTRWNASTGGLVSSCFWVYARMDVWAAFCKESRTLLPTSDWTDDEDAFVQRSQMDPARHAHAVVLLFAQIVNFTAGARDQPASSRRAAWSRLQKALAEWPRTGAEEAQPLCVVPSSRSPFPGFTEASPFESILFSSESSSTGWAMFHAATILLYEAAVAEGMDHGLSSVDDAIYYHASSACAIIASNPHPACLVNAIQPLWISGRNLRHADEKMFTLHLLSVIQRKTGWSCEWRMRCLRRHWNIEP